MVKHCAQEIYYFDTALICLRFPLKRIELRKIMVLMSDAINFAVCRQQVMRNSFGSDSNSCKQFIDHDQKSNQEYMGHEEKSLHLSLIGPDSLRRDDEIRHFLLSHRFYNWIHVRLMPTYMGEEPKNEC